MSKIFDAVRKGDGDITDMVLSVLEEQEAQARDGSVTTASMAPEPPAPAPTPVVEQQPAATARTAVALPPVQVPATVALPSEAPGVPREPAAPVRTKMYIDARRTMPLKVFLNSPLLPFDTNNWRASEQYRSIRTRIMQHPNSPRMVLVTSAGPGDGKTTTALNVAGALSLTGESNVLFLDGDFRRSAITRTLSLPQSPGLTDVLLGQATLEEALIKAEQFPNLYVLTNGTTTENPGDLLESSRWTNLQKQILSKFQFVVIDSPPVGAVSEFDLMATAADGILVVARPDHTSLQDFLKGLGAIRDGKLIGVVMNCVSDWFLSRPYSAYEYSRR